MKKHVFIHIILFGYLSLCFGQQQTLDSIRELRALSKNENLNKTTRLNHAKTAQQLAYKLDIDSVIINTNFCLIKTYKRVNSNFEIEELLRQNLFLAKKSKDSFSLGLSSLYKAEHFRDNPFYKDSSLKYFYSSKKIFKSLNSYILLSRSLFGISAIQCYEKDYSGSINSSFEALSFLKLAGTSVNSKKIESYIYNNLGIVYGQLNKFNTSIVYQKKSLSIKTEVYGSNNEKVFLSKNNLANVYNRMGEYNEAVKYLKPIVENKSLINNFPIIYILALDNYAYSLFKLKKTENAYSFFLKALKISTNSNLEYESIIVNQHLAEYHYYQKNKDSAKYYAYNAKKISSHYYRDDVLKSLKVLTLVEDDSIAVKHYDAYIKLSDSLLQEERLNRNKFARIQFETDTYIEENEKLEERNTLISVFSIIAIVILLLLFVIANQIAKNQKLKFEQAQQQANADIYNLMLNEQHKIQEGRLNERYHIAEELHDGVLNTLAGTRMGIEYLSTLHPEAIKKYELYITELQKTERDIRNLSHSLKHSKLDAQQGFMSIVKSYTDNTSKLHHFSCKITEHQDIDWESITDLTKVNLFRIIQEALHNVAKHANASTVNISFNLYDNEKLQITITDNGNGFDTSQKAEGIGLQNIQSRCERLNGTYEISSAIGEGTTLTINVPV